MSPRSSVRRKLPTRRKPPRSFLSHLSARTDTTDVSAEVFRKLGYTPTPRQELFHQATEFDVLYGGAAGGGKSKALLLEGIRNCVKYPGMRVVAFRRTYPELEESLITELRGVDYAAPLGAVYKGGSHNLIFPNGSLFMFRYSRNLQDATIRQGGQFQLILFDEMTLFPPEVVEFLSSRLRSGSSLIPVLGIRSGSNPGGIGHAAAKKKYIDATDKGTKVITDERGRLVRFIPSRVDDNPHVNVEYRTDLLALTGARRAAFLEGSWDSFSGQVFTEWNDGRHLVPRFKLPTQWRRAIGVDYGWAAPWVVLWAAVDQDGRVYVYREITDTQVIEREQAKRILASEGSDERIHARYADPAMWAKTGEARSVADQYASEGVQLEAGQNDRLIGKQRVHTYLSEGPACAYHRDLGWETCPLLHVFEGAAPELARTLPSLPYDPKHVEDVDTNAEDHHYDALRYLLMGLGEGHALEYLTKITTPCRRCGRPTSTRGESTCAACASSSPAAQAERGQTVVTPPPQAQPGAAAPTAEAAPRGKPGSDSADGAGGTGEGSRLPPWFNR